MQSRLNQYNDWEILCENATLCAAGLLLTFWAGAINAVTSFSVLFLRSAHMSGPTTDQAKYLVTNPVMALLVSLTIVSFICGAFAGTKGFLRLGFTPALALTAAPVLLAAIFIRLGYYGTERYSMEAGRFLMAILLPFAMGWQNSVTSQGRIGRTTHITGDITDLGIALARRDSRAAAYLFVKYLGFVTGGVSGYLALRFEPGTVLAVCAVGFATTVLAFHWRNSFVVIQKKQLEHLFCEQSLLTVNITETGRH